MKIVVFLLVLSFGLLLASNPGFKARVTQSGLNYANSVAMKALSKAIRQMKIPDQSGKSGGISFYITGMRITGFQTPHSTMSLTGTGLKWTATGAGLAMHGDFKYKYKKGWIKISDHGNFDASLGGVSFNLAVSLSDTAGKPHLVGSKCASDIGKVGIKFHGGASWIYNLFSKYISGKVKDILNKQMCSLVVKAINTDANNQLAKLPMTVTLVNKFLLDYSLNGNPSFNTRYLETSHKGEVYWKGDKKECPFKPNPFPASSRTSKMLYLWVSEYMGNSLGYAGYNHGFLRYNLTAKDLPPGNRSLFNTTCKLKCIGTLIPQIGKLYPNSQVVFRMHATGAPVIDISKGIININFTGSIDLYAHTPKGQTPFLMTIDIGFLINVTASIQGQLIKGKITNNKVNVKVGKSAVGPVPSFVLQLMMNAAIDGFVVPTLNAQGQKGLTLPVTENIKFSNAQLTLIEGAVVVATDLTYLSDLQLARLRSFEKVEVLSPGVLDKDHADLDTDHADLKWGKADPRKNFNVVGEKNIIDQI